MRTEGDTGRCRVSEGGIKGGREGNKGGKEMKVVSTTDVKTTNTEANAWRLTLLYDCREVDTGLAHTYIWMHALIHPNKTKTCTRAQYLCGYTLAGTVLQKEAYHLQVILLGCHVQRSEAILHTAWTKTHFYKHV